MKNQLSKTVLLAILCVLAGYTAGYLSPNSTAAPGHQMTPATMAALEKDAMNNMVMEELHEAADAKNPPLISKIQVEPDQMAGWNIYFDYENFTFTPEYASSAHVPATGHAHLHINGEKVARLYTNAYHLKALPPGDHVISIYLNTNDHKEYVVNGLGTGREIVVTAK